MTTVEPPDTGRLLTALDVLDAELDARGSVSSLGPGRPRATALAALVSRRLAGQLASSLAEVVAPGVARIVRAVREAFPDNLFWDFDHMVTSLVEQALAAERPAAAYEAGVDAIVGLQEQFGHQTVISFRYVHDFLYGFDWAKWVAKDPPTRAAVGPFDPRFVEVMRKRGEALLELIDEGTDSKYPPLSEGRHRNPFGFSRAPRAELVLHRYLARQGLVPVEGWREHAEPQWNRDFAELRRRAAHALGLTDMD